jgi:hypothetical protein
MVPRGRIARCTQDYVSGGEHADANQEIICSLFKILLAPLQPMKRATGIGFISRVLGTQL